MWNAKSVKVFLAVMASIALALCIAYSVVCPAGQAEKNVDYIVVSSDTVQMAHDCGVAIDLDGFSYDAGQDVYYKRIES